MNAVALKVVVLIGFAGFAVGCDRGGQGGPGSYPIRAEALVGCRAPAEPGCTRCCESTSTADRLCLTKESSPAADWYDESASIPGPCAAECAACAQCSERGEQDLRSFPARPECNCNSIVIGGDPCFGAGSCACYCFQLDSAMRVCPRAL